jgi:uncharacterized protein YcaQ
MRRDAPSAHLRQHPLDVSGTVPRAVLEAHFGRGLLAVAERRRNFARAFDLAELVTAGELREVRVEGWRETAYLHPRAKRPPRIEAAALLSPFDPVVWYRPRTSRLFGFDYRLEIFVPRPKRRWGYSCFPSCSGIGWSRAWTSRPSVRFGAWMCWPPTPSPACVRDRWPKPWRPS